MGHEAVDRVFQLFGRTFNIETTLEDMRKDRLVSECCDINALEEHVREIHQAEESTALGILSSEQSEVGRKLLLHVWLMSRQVLEPARRDHGLLKEAIRTLVASHDIDLCLVRLVEANSEFRDRYDPQSELDKQLRILEDLDKGRDNRVQRDLVKHLVLTQAAYRCTRLGEFSVALMQFDAALEICESHKFMDVMPALGKGIALWRCGDGKSGIELLASPALRRQCREHGRVATQLYRRVWLVRAAVSTRRDTPQGTRTYAHTAALELEKIEKALEQHYFGEIKLVKESTYSDYLHAKGLYEFVTGDLEVACGLVRDARDRHASTNNQWGIIDAETSLAEIELHRGGVSTHELRRQVRSCEDSAVRFACLDLLPRIHVLRRHVPE